jgi:hypothetical protein
VAGGAGAPATQELHCGEKRREKEGGNLLGCSPSADFEQKRRISRVKARRSLRFLFRLLQQAAARAAEQGAARACGARFGAAFIGAPWPGQFAMGFGGPEAGLGRCGSSPRARPR